VAYAPHSILSPTGAAPVTLPNFQFTHRYKDFATHQPVLYEAVVRSTGPVLELGCGEGSSHLLHALCARDGRRLLTLDNDRGWLEPTAARLAADFHEFGLVEDWNRALLSRQICNTAWGVVFIDGKPWESRTLAVHLFKHTATFVVVHDVDYFPHTGSWGVETAPIRGPHNRGHRDYSELFSSWREYFPSEPWPYSLTGPPTLLGSNRVSCDIDIDYAAYL
jgi:hypothetical protein